MRTVRTTRIKIIKNVRNSEFTTTILVIYVESNSSHNLLGFQIANGSMAERRIVRFLHYIAGEIDG